MLPKVFLFAIVIFVCGSCNKSRNNESTSWCSGQAELTGTFIAEETFQDLNTAWPYYPTDSLSVNMVRFTATDSLADEWEWKIGAAVYTTKTVTLQFPDDFLKQQIHIPVTLTVKRKASPCFPQDQTGKKSTREILFTDSTLVNGTFSGALDGNNFQTFAVTVNTKSACSNIPNGPNNTFNVSIANLVNGCEILVGSCYGGSYKTGYRQLLFTAQSCMSPGGVIKVSPGNKDIVIDYVVYENGFQQPVVHHSFHGRRVN